MLFEVETDKATLEVESPADGCVKAILIDVGQTVSLTNRCWCWPIATSRCATFYHALVHEGTAPAETVPEHVTAEEHAAAAPETMPSSPPPKPTAPMEPAERLFATPRAKLIAQELGIDLRGVTPANAIRIVEADVRRAAQSAQKAAPPVTAAQYTLGQKIPLNRLQRIVAEKMLWSKQNIPCFYLNIRADVTELVALRAKLNKTAPVKLSFNDFILRALAIGMQHYPIMTGQLDGDFIRLAASLDFGLAISTEQGLVAPIVRNCGTKSVYDIAAYCKELIERTRSGKLSLDDLEGGCITVSNLGGFGIESFIPIVVPGQTSILGVGAIIDTVVPSDGNLLVRKLMTLTLSVNHKVVNSAEAAQFLDFVKKQLEHPDTLLIEPGDQKATARRAHAVALAAGSIARSELKRKVHCHNIVIFCDIIAVRLAAYTTHQIVYFWPLDRQR